VLRILTKHLTNERAWLRTENLGSMDARYREGARMAKERIPQLEAAIELIVNSTESLVDSATKTKPTPKAKATGVRQLNLFQIFKPTEL
jgi:hypothetical protein